MIELPGHRFATSEKFLLACITSLISAFIVFFWAIGAVKDGGSGSLTGFLFALTMGLFWVAYITGRSWQILLADKKKNVSGSDYQKNKPDISFR